MSSGLLRRLRRTVGFRLALWYAAVFFLGCLVLFSLAYLILSSSLKDRDRETILLKLRELAMAYQSQGMAALEREVNIDKKFGQTNPFFIRVAGAHDQTLFLLLPYQWIGLDLKRLGGPSPPSGTQWVLLPLEGRRYAVEVATAPLPGGYLLQVGMSTESRQTTLRHFLDIFAVIMIPVVLLACISGAFVAHRALRPLRILINAVRAVEPASLDARVPSPGTGDELDELVGLFNQMLMKIESLVNGMRDSLDHVAHDLRTPMTRLRGVAEMALEQGNGAPEAYREALADAMEESERILTMLNTIMDISEAETGTMRLNRKAVELNAVVKQVIDVYRLVAEEKGVSIRWRADDGSTTFADPGRLRQAIANLLDNAIKYTPGDGHVAVEVAQKAEWAMIRVRDTGVGIPAEELSRIWDRHYRGDESRSQRGLGLGLSLVRAIVQAHGGKIDVHSEPGKGTTFTISLPSND